MVPLRASHWWAAPITDSAYIGTAEGSLYVAAVVDPFSGRVVGWARKSEMTTQLVTDTLITAI